MRRGTAEGRVGLVFALALAGACARPSVPEVVAAPPALASHVMTYHAGLRQVVLFGGSDPERVYSGSLWGWDGTRWSELSRGGPEPRIHAALAYDSHRDRLVLHGGIKSRDESFGDTWEWDGQSWTRRADATMGPGIRDHHAMTYDAERGVVVLYGGQNLIDEYLSETWEWDGESWERQPGAGPPARSTHRLVYDSDRRQVVLFGGWGPEAQLDDLWSYDTSGWQRIEESGPTARGANRVAYDSARGQLVLFGGLVGREASAETWLFADGWMRQDVPGPSARNVHGMAFDSHRNRVVLYGGIGADGRLADTWEWDGEVWVRVP